MKSYINDMIVADPNGEKSILYPTTKQEAVEGLQDRLTNIEIPDITTTDQTTLSNSHSGRVLIEHIGGNMEQKSTEGNQLFDKSMISSGTGISTSDGTLYASNYTFSTYYMNVSNISSIAWNAKSSDAETWGAFYDENNNFIKTFNVKTLYVNVPSGAHYARLTFLNEYLSTAMVNSGTEVLPYEEYSGGKPSPSPSYPQEIKGVKGKNLLDCRGLTEQTIKGVTFTPKYSSTDEDVKSGYPLGSLMYIEANGTATGDSDYIIGIFTLVPNEKYILNGCPSGGNTTTYRLSYTNVGSEYGSGLIFYNENEITGSLFIRITNGYTANNLRFYPMIRSASVLDDTYVPYGLIRIKGHGKNFFKHTAISTTKNGIVTTVNADRSITMKGASTVEYTSSFVLGAIALPAGSYIATGCPSGGSSTTYCIRLGLGSNGETYLGTVVGEGYSFELTEEQIVEVRIHVNGKVTINETFYPMIREASIENSTYEPYTEHSITLSKPMEWYGNEDVQDLLNGKENVRKFKEITLNSNDNWALSYSGQYYYTVVNDGKIIGGYIYSTHFNMGVWSVADDTANVICIGNGDRAVIGITTSSFASLDELKAFLANNEVKVVYELAEPTTEALPIADQIALNSLLSYDGITYVEFDCEIQPTWKAKYGTSEVGGYTLESLLVARNNELKQELANERLSALEASVVNNI